MNGETVGITLELIVPGTLTVFGLAFVGVWAIERKLAHLLHLAAACALFSVGACLQIVQWPRDAGLNAVVSCAFYTSAVLFAAQGLFRLAGLRLALLAGLSAGAIILGLVWYFSYIDRNLQARSFAMNVGYGLILLWSTWRLRHLWRARFIDSALFAILLVFSVQFCARTLLAAGFGAPPPDARAVGETLFWQALQLSLAVLGTALAMVALAVAVTNIIEDLRRQRDTDKLTGVLNRQGFDERVRAVLASGSTGPLSVVLCDIDHFKSINDTFGHDVGDRALRLFGRLLTESVDVGDPVGRIGGEEFAILLKGRSAREALRWVDLFRAKLDGTEFVVPEGAIRVTASFGIAEAEECDTLSSIMKRGDTELYRAKRAGRNRTSVARNAARTTDRLASQGI